MGAADAGPLAEAGLQDTTDVGDLSGADNAVPAPKTNPAENVGDAELEDILFETATGKTREERDAEETTATMASLEAGDKITTGRVPTEKLELSKEVPQWKEGQRRG